MMKLRLEPINNYTNLDNKISGVAKLIFLHDKTCGHIGNEACIRWHFDF